MIRFHVVVTGPQRTIFDQVKAFVLARRSSSSSKTEKARQKLAMKNVFSARERKFISSLAEELHLSVRWDEFAVVGGGDTNEEEGDGGEEEEVNVVTWRFPGDDDDDDEEEEERDGGQRNDEDEGGVKDSTGNGNADTNDNGANTGADAVVDVPITVAADGNDDDEWVDEDEDDDEDDEDDEESRAAIDRVLGKYEKAKVFDDDEGFDERHERKIEEKMAEWKAGYYEVWIFFSLWKKYEILTSFCCTE